MNFSNNNNLDSIYAVVILRKLTYILTLLTFNNQFHSIACQSAIQ